MAAEVQATPDVEVESVPVTKTVESASTTATEEATSATSVHEETPMTNGIQSEETTASGADVDDVAKVETDVKKEEGEVEVSEDATTTEGQEVAGDAAATTDEQAEPAVEEPKETVPPKVILHQFPRGKEVPSLSPFCLKVETYLRINEIPYENQLSYKMGKKGKLPWIEYNGERKSDSKLIIEYLSEKFEVALDSEVTPEHVALGRAVTSMLEENTYWALIFNRFVDNFNEYKKVMGQGTGLAFNMNQKMFQRKMRSNLDGHGLGRHSKDEVYKIAADDLKALSIILGEKEFLLGDKISSFDCAVFGVCANILYSGMDTPMKTFIKENAANVSNLCDKIKEAYWSDWLDVVEGDKPAEPSLKKGFSFKKKKNAAPKKEAQTESTEGEAVEVEGAAEDATTEEATAEASTAEEAPAVDSSAAVTPETPEPAAAPVEPAAAPVEPAAAPAEATTAPAEATTAPAEATTAPAEATTAPAEATTAPAEATTAPAEASTAPAEATTTALVETTTEPAEATTEPVEPTAAPAEPTVTEGTTVAESTPEAASE